MHTYIHTYIHISIYTPMYTHTHAYIYIYIYTGWTVFKHYPWTCSNTCKWHQVASSLIFPRRQTLQPKFLTPNPEDSASQTRKHGVYAVFTVFSLMMFDNEASSMLQWQTMGCVGLARTSCKPLAQKKAWMATSRHGVTGALRVSGWFFLGKAHRGRLWRAEGAASAWCAFWSIYAYIRGSNPAKEIETYRFGI